jgi:RecB family exonuclease
MLVTLSYPEFDARGERNLESLYLEDLILTPVEAQAVRPEPRFAPLPRGPMEILAPGLRDYLLQKTAKLSPTALETFLQCPFQYFSRSILRLKPAPGRPEERLDFLTQGNIVHAVLAEWWQQPQEMAPLFERIFERYLEEKLIPSGYHTERLRNAMLEDLCKFASEDKWPRGAFQSRTEEGFVFPIGDSLEVSGKIDRLDTTADGQAYVIDYKYSVRSVRDRVQNPSLLQAPLYLMAAERVLGMKPAGMFYVGVKGGIEYAGWSEASLMDSLPMPENWLKITEQRTLQVVDQIRAGRVEVAPANPDNCRFCDFSDVCRIEVRAAVVAVAGQGDGEADGQAALELKPTHRADQLDALILASGTWTPAWCGPGSGKLCWWVPRRRVAEGVESPQSWPSLPEGGRQYAQEAGTRVFQEDPQPRPSERLSYGAWFLRSAAQGECHARGSILSRVSDDREAWRMQLGDGRRDRRGGRETMRGLIRGPSSYESKMPCVRPDAMRGAGVRVPQPAEFNAGWIRGPDSRT